MKSIALVEKIIRLLKLPAIPSVIAFFITILFLMITFFVTYLNRSMELQHERLIAISKLGIIRSELEGELNARLLLGQGLVSYISLRPGLTGNEFLEYTAKLVSNDPMIRNISALKNTTIIYAYPMESNRKAIGVDIAAIPAQREGVLRVIETGSTYVAPNIKLVQGGTGVVCRMPVYTGSDKKYWGQVSLVLMQDVLFSQAGISQSSHGLKILLQIPGNDGLPGDILSGDSKIADEDPVVLDVTFPYGSWRLSGMPEQGWGHSDRTSIRYAGVGAILSLVIGLLILTVLKLGQRIEQLENILPICSNCKKIRNDKGYWDSVDSFFALNPAFRFSHGLCPDCADKLYGDKPWYKRRRGGNDSGTES